MPPLRDTPRSRPVLRGLFGAFVGAMLGFLVSGATGDPWFLLGGAVVGCVVAVVFGVGALEFIMRLWP